MDEGMITIVLTTAEGNKTEVKGRGDDNTMIELAKVLFKKA